MIKSFLIYKRLSKFLLWDNWVLIFFYVWPLCLLCLFSFKVLDSFLQIIKISLLFWLAFVQEQVHKSSYHSNGDSCKKENLYKFEKFAWNVRILDLS